MRGLRATVLGAGRSGRAAAALLCRRGARVVLTDLRTDVEPLPGVELVLGRHESEHLVDTDLLVVSPGIPRAAPPVQVALHAGVRVVGELGLACSLLEATTPVVGVTGTNGKSTVTSWTAALLSATGRTVFAGGNLGTPLAAAVDHPWDVVVIEVSSYQLELPDGLRTNAACILNLTPDHLARHGTLEGYAAAKARLFDTLVDDDALALIPENPLLERAAAGRRGRRAWLGRLPGVLLEGQEAVFDDGRVDLSGLRAAGAINRVNAAVACLLAHAVGVPLTELRPELLEPLPHRMEPVATVDGVTWVNDSKATNVDATLAGLAGLGGSAVVLLGGQGKDGADYAPLRPALEVLARGVVCFGASGPVVAGALEGLPVHLVGSLAEAVAVARQVARPGDRVVLSPACASFDEFRDFEHRGEVFRALAHAPRTAPEPRP